MTAPVVSRRTMRGAAGLAIALVLGSMSATASAQGTTLDVRPSPAYTPRIAPGSQLALSWSGIAAPSTTDWIGVYQDGAADTAYKQWTYTTGAANGTRLLTLPRSLTPGLYELRLFARNSYTRLARAWISVQPPSDGVFLSRSPGWMWSGYPTTVGWNQIIAPSPTDWIGFYRKGAPDNAYITYFYTDGSSTGSKRFTVPAGLAKGEYEFRLFSDNSYTFMARMSHYVLG
jgi:hypothetical protein